MWILIFIFISLALQRTFFRRMDTQAIVKFLLTASCALSTVQRTFFCQKAGIRSKKFFDKQWHSSFKSSVKIRFDRVIFMPFHNTTYIFSANFNPHQKFLFLSLYNGQIFGKWWHPTCKVSVNFSTKRNAEDLLQAKIEKIFFQVRTFGQIMM